MEAPFKIAFLDHVAIHVTNLDSLLWEFQDLVQLK